ncbi:MAG: hypothetical protein KDC13_09685 [Bacteroidetes bacterium]|nr:hypothetical protein [Bacteroidota bacterium]
MYLFFNSIRRGQPLIIAFAVCMVIFSCKHEIPLVEDPGNQNNNGNNNGNNNNNNNNNNNEHTLICFETQILPIFQTNCAKSGCHDAITHEDGIHLYDYDHIIQRIEPGDPYDGKIMESIFETEADETMPPPPNTPLSADQIALLTTWILQGAQNTTGCSSGVCDSSSFTYSSDIAPIMQTHCNGCHSGTYPSAGINTSNYQGLSTIAQTGELTGSVNHTNNFSAMPQNAAMLDICKRTKINKWVQAGYPNN